MSGVRGTSVMQPADEDTKEICVGRAPKLSPETGGFWPFQNCTPINGGLGLRSIIVADGGFVIVIMDRMSGEI